MAIRNVPLTNTINSWRQDFNGLATEVGDLTLLNTTNKTNVVSAINEALLASGVDSAATVPLARSSISVTDAGGDGSLSYNSSTGVITYTGPSAAEVRAHVSATSPLSYNSTTGVISVGDATTSVKGVASFSSANFAVSSGAVSIATGGVGATQLATDAVTTVKITNSNVTYAKIQNIVTANRVLGSTSAGAAVSEVQVNSNMLSSAVTLIIYNSAGTAVKTLYGAGV